MSDRVSVVLVNYNGRNDLGECLSSLRNQSYCNIDIIVVDNASTDDSIFFLRKHYPEIKIIQASENIGFGDGCNLGIQFALGTPNAFVLLLNIDTIIDRNMIFELMKYADPNTVVAPKIYRYRDNKKTSELWYSGGELDLNTGEINQVFFEDDINAPQVTDFMTGCCMLIHRNIFERIGMFSSEYFLYYEDTDLCFRMKRMGVRLLYIPTAKMYHKVGGSGEGEVSCLNQYYITRNRLYFMNKFAAELPISSLNILKRIMCEREYLEYEDKYQIYLKAAIRDFLEGNMKRGKHGSMLLMRYVYPIYGFHGLESAEHESWFWSTKDYGEIAIVNPLKKGVSYQISFSVFSAPGFEDAEFVARCAGYVWSSVKSGEKLTIVTSMVSEERKNLKVIMNGEGKYGGDDRRKLKFQIKNLQVNKIEKQSEGYVNNLLKNRFCVLRGAYELEKNVTDYWFWASRDCVEIAIFNPDYRERYYRISFILLPAPCVTNYKAEIEWGNGIRRNIKMGENAEFLVHLQEGEQIKRILFRAIGEGRYEGDDTRNLKYQIQNLTIDIV